MNVRDGFVGTIGNPGGSVKDRAALYLILADSGTRYQSKLFNPAFLKEKGLPFPDWL